MSAFDAVQDGGSGSAAARHPQIPPHRGRLDSEVVEEPHDDWRLRLPESARRRIRHWLGTIAAMTFLVLAVGGVTRLTHSGLSIVDWRPFVGVVPPLSQSEWVDNFERYQQFPEYRQLRPHMTLAEYKRIFFWEYLHRVLARLTGLVFLVPFAFFWLSGTITRPLAWRALALFALGATQGLVGWLMVQSGLIDRPSVSHYGLAAHLFLALAIFGQCIWLIRDLSLGVTRPAVAAVARRRAGRALIAVGGLLGLQIVWGAFVAGLKAGLVFNTFPLMDGALVPFTYWTSSPAALDLIQQPSGVQWLHRVIGTVLVVAAYLLRRGFRQLSMDRTSITFSVVLLWATAAQYALGVLTLVLFVPVGFAVAHQAMAMVIVGLWVGAVHHVRHLATAPATRRVNS